MLMDKDIYFMKEALIEAKKAYEKAEIPVGCVIVLNDEIIGRGYNESESKKNPLNHAEIIAISNAAKKINAKRLLNSEIYVTLEPCIMCCGAIISARIKRLIYGANDLKRGCCGSAIDIMGMEFHNHHSEITRGILKEECEKLLTNFFKELRAGKIQKYE